MKKVSVGPFGYILVSVFLCCIATPTSSLAQLSPASADDAYAESYQLFADGLFEQSSSAFETFRKSNPDDVRVPNALYYEAQSLLNSEQYGTAVDRLDLFRSTYPDHPLAYEARLSLGKFYY